MAGYANVDDWANRQIGKFFPASTNNTLSDGDLTGQCVTLDKWFLNDLTSVPNPGIARGDAKDFGDRLVSEGHAVQVTEAARQPGDIVVWKKDGGGYGHTGVLLNHDRVFEQNIAGLGSSTRIITNGRDSWTVHASRIDPLYASWRKMPAQFYRVKTYQSGDKDVPAKLTLDSARILSNGILGRNGVAGRPQSLDGSSDEDLRNHVGTDLTNEWLLSWYQSAEARQWRDSGDDNSVGGINRRLANPVIKEVIVEKPVEVVKEVIKEVPVDRIVEKVVVKEVVVGDVDRTAGDLIVAGIKKLFGVK